MALWLGVQELTEQNKEQQQLIDELREAIGVVSEDGSIGDGTVDGVTGQTGFIQMIKKTLASLGLFIENGIAQIREVITDKITTKTAKIEKMEMIDQATGEVYCTWIENGEWKKVKGECGAISATGPDLTSDKGCTDPGALNYNPNAITDDDSCKYPIEGCTDTDALNYNKYAGIDDGSCEYPPVEGCIDPTATNYNPEATTDDGSCAYPEPELQPDIEGCTDPSATNYNPDATIDSGSCEYPQPEPQPDVEGCTDSAALNYNPDATVDDGSCQYEVLGCIDPASLNYNPEATTDDGSCQYPLEGCTDSAATNYNPDATVDNGSCEYPQSQPEPQPDAPGCTDSSAINYNPDAATDDGSCTYNISKDPNPRTSLPDVPSAVDTTALQGAVE